MSEFKKIFISYSRTDGSDFASRLSLDLKQEGFNVWIDQQDIRAGSEWDLEVQNALETCDCLLFIESEKSVVSNNVLDEVYYALGQQKKVIPIIFHDSKTPFRLQRLQHVDFTTNYKKGLLNLIKELNSDANADLSQPGEVKEFKKSSRPKFTKSSRLILVISIIALIIAAIIYSININKKPNDKTGNEVNLSDRRGDGNSIDTTTKTASKKEDPLVTETGETKEKTRGNNNVQNKPSGKTGNLNETLVGDWELVDVDPKAESKKGYLKIEETGERKVRIKSFFQFYYFKTNDTAFLSVFNGFAGCSSCILQDEMKITAEDMAIGSRYYQILKEARPGVGKAGDTLQNAGSNKSFRASVSLRFINDKTALIKVQRTDAISLSNGIVVAPFVYSFRFIKAE